MTFAAALAAMALTGFSISWSSFPDRTGSAGSARVEIFIDAEDLLAVISDDGPVVRYEITATIDGGMFQRRGGTAVDGSFPMSEVLEFGPLSSGEYALAVALTDLESGLVRRASDRISVDFVEGDVWSSGALRISPGGTMRVSDRLRASWDVYPPEQDEAPEVAFAILDSSTETVREGWMSLRQAENGTASYAVEVPLSGLQKGSYRLAVAALSESRLVASATASLRLMESWDVWGENASETETLIRAIASTWEISELRRAGGPGDRNSVMADFWNRRDPNPATRGNEYLSEYLQRLDTIARLFTTTGVRGINTDRGIVYAKMGAPDIVSDHPFEAGYPYVTWQYFTPSLSLSFVDRSGYGFYELVEDWNTVNRAFNSWEDWAE